MEKCSPWKTLTRFLKKEKAYESFIFYLEKDWGRKTVMIFFQETNPTEYITNAFPWLYTKEGVRYWDKLDNKWYQILNGKNLQDS